MPQVSLIVPVYRNLPGLRACIESVLANGDAVDWELVVADNEGDVAVEQMTTCDPRIRYVRELAVGSYAARNAGVRAATGDILAFTDSDCTVAPGYLEAVVRSCPLDAPVVCCGPAVIEVSAADATPYAYLDSVYGLRQAEAAARGFARTANLFVSHRNFDAIGPFEQRLRSGGDAEWTRRATSRGYALHFIDDARVFHPPRTTFREHDRKNARIDAGLIERARLDPAYPLAVVVRDMLTPPLRKVVRLQRNAAIPRRLRGRCAAALLRLWISRALRVVPMLLSARYRARFR